MTTLSKRNSRDGSATDTGLEGLIVGWLLQRFKELPSESLKDLVELIEISREAPEEERYEIFETLREILFPELVGKIKEIDSGEQAPAKLQNRASWIGRKVKYHREQKGLTQADLAGKSGLQQSQISRMEAGEHSPSFKTLDKIAKALGVEIGDIDPAN